MKNKKAFTLIELLVVVLIIGILAAIALPQYEKAVEKTRFMQRVVLLRALVNAQEVYYLANGKYSSRFDELDIQMPAQGAESPEEGFSFITVNSLGISLYEDEVTAYKSATDPRLVCYYSHIADQEAAGRCGCYGWNEKAIGICKTFGKLEQEYDSSNLNKNTYWLD